MQIDCANQPVEIFSFLQENSIGIYRACLYEAHAIVLETQGRYQEATEVYEKGIKMYAFFALAVCLSCINGVI